MEETITKICDLTISELVDYERACKIVIEHYSNIVRRYDGSFNPEMGSESKKLIEIQAIHNAIIMCMEAKINEL